MTKCLYCLCTEETATFTSVEHIIPESLGNTSIILEKGVVCDKCNNEVLSLLDNILLGFDPISFLRTNYSIPNKSGKLPTAKFGNMIMKSLAPGQLQITTNSRRTWTDTSTGFNIHVKGSRKWTSYYQKQLCRALYKITLGLIYLDHGEEVAYSKRYDEVRKFILGTEDFHGYIAIANKSKILPKTQLRYDFITIDGVFTTWVEANFMGVTMFTDLESRTLKFPDALGDAATIFTF